MNKSIRKSLCLCAAALMIGGVVAPSISNNISASAHSRYTVSRYSHKKNVHKYDTKRIMHLQSVHKYHLKMEAKDKHNLANHKKALAHYNHLLRVHKHNRKMINNLTRSKHKLIKMIKNDQRGIARYSKYVESEEHQINVARGKAKQARNHKHSNTISLAKYNSLISQGYYDGSHGKRTNARGSKQERAVYNSGYIKGLAKFSRDLKKLHNEATINHTRYLNSIAYAAGFDDGYHNDTNNQMNPTLIKLLHSWTGHIKDIYVQGLKAGQKARVNMENHKNKTVIPKVIIPSNFNKIVKPIVNNKSKNVKPSVIPNPNADQNNPYSSSKDRYWYNQGYKFAYNHTGMYVDSHLSNALNKAGNNKIALRKGITAGTKARINWDSSHHNSGWNNRSVYYNIDI